MHLSWNASEAISLCEDFPLTIFSNILISFELLTMNYIKFTYSPEMQCDTNVLQKLVFQLVSLSVKNAIFSRTNLFVLSGLICWPCSFCPSALYWLCFLSASPRFYLGLMPGLSVHCYIVIWFTALNIGITITLIISYFPSQLSSISMDSTN